MTVEKPRKTRLFFVDNLRILLIILLVLHHLAITYGHSGEWYYYDGRPDDLTVLLATLFTAVNQAFFLAFFFRFPHSSSETHSYHLIIWP